MRSYNENSGRQNLKKIISNPNLKREEKESLLMELNSELSSEDNKIKMILTLSKLKNLGSEMCLDKKLIKKDLVN